jgi:hypothetical protein
VSLDPGRWRIARSSCTVAAMFFSRLFPGLVLLASCGSGVECKTEVTQGSGVWTGLARGKSEDPQTRRDSLRDACRQMCAATKAEVMDACAASCAVDAEAGKIGMKTTCGGK